MDGVVGGPGIPENDPAGISPERLHGYELAELDRGASRLQSYRVLDGRGPLGTLADLCDSPGRKVVLDGGCGTGRQLYSMLWHVGAWYNRNTDEVEAHGVSQYDFRGLSRSSDVNDAFVAGRLGYFVADLTTQPLPPELYHLIYSDEVVVHSDNPSAIVMNLWQALRPGGDLYFNALEVQRGVLESGALGVIREAGGVIIDAQSESPLIQAITVDEQGRRPAPRRVYKATKPDRYGWLDAVFKAM